jgi:hypothetical protein
LRRKMIPSCADDAGEQRRPAFDGQKLEQRRVQ